ncbi:MAG: PEP-CTERM sorting domain-containing protein [Nitrospirae bacterium]|nr:MAG: PEP-CTERM sorting domain-containing protein [Nitrospirota bacterium]
MTVGKHPRPHRLAVVATLLTLGLAALPARAALLPVASLTVDRLDVVFAYPGFPMSYFEYHGPVGSPAPVVAMGSYQDLPGGIFSLQHTDGGVTADVTVYTTGDYGDPPPSADADPAAHSLENVDLSSLRVHGTMTGIFDGFAFDVPAGPPAAPTTHTYDPATGEYHLGWIAPVPGGWNLTVGFSGTAATVPEPASAGLIATALFGLLALRRRT